MSRRHVGAERPADLHRADRPAGRGATTDIVQQLAQREPESPLDQPGAADVARELNRECAARLTQAEVCIGIRAVREDPGYGGERHHVVDDGRLAEEALDRRQWRPDADFTAL